MVSFSLSLFLSLGFSLYASVSPSHSSSTIFFIICFFTNIVNLLCLCVIGVVLLRVVIIGAELQLRRRVGDEPRLCAVEHKLCTITPLTLERRQLTGLEHPLHLTTHPSHQSVRRAPLLVSAHLSVRLPQKVVR